MKRRSYIILILVGWYCSGYSQYIADTSYTAQSAFAKDRIQFPFIRIAKVPKDKKCKIGGCKHKDKHTTEGHICHYCCSFGIKNHIKNCPKNGASILDNPNNFGSFMQEEVAKYDIKLN